MKDEKDPEQLEKRNMALETGAIDAVGDDRRKTIETVGAGRCVIPIEKVHCGGEEFGYRLQLLRMRSRRSRRLGRIFTPRDVLDLPKLVQVLAATLVADGCLAEGLKDDLACLAATLDIVVGPGGRRKKSPWVLVPRKDLQQVVDYCWKDEKEDSQAEGGAGHVFQSLETLRRALGGR